MHGEQHLGRLQRPYSMRRQWHHHYGTLVLLCVCYGIYLSTLWIGRYMIKEGRDEEHSDSASMVGTNMRTLAIAVPMHAGDVARAMESMKRWPTGCSFDTLRAVDLILYHAEDVDEKHLLAWLPVEASRCFRKTKVVSAYLTEEVRKGTNGHSGSRPAHGSVVVLVIFKHRLSVVGDATIRATSTDIGLLSKGVVEIILETDVFPSTKQSRE